MSHILVIQRTEYPLYWYLRGGNIQYTGISDRIAHMLVFQRRGQNIPYTCNSEDTIPHVLVIQRTEYPMYL